MANPVDTGKAETWITDRLPADTIAPKSGNTGTFDRWFTDRLTFAWYTEVAAAASVEVTAATSAALKKIMAAITSLGSVFKMLTAVAAPLNAILCLVWAGTVAFATSLAEPVSNTALYQMSLRGISTQDVATTAYITRAAAMVDMVLLARAATASTGTRDTSAVLFRRNLTAEIPSR